MSGLLWQLWDRFVLFLASLNPVTKAKVEKLKAEAVELEAERERFLAEVEARKQENTLLLVELTENNRKTIELENSILHAKEALQKRIDERARLSDMDKLELDV